MGSEEDIKGKNTKDAISENPFEETLEEDGLNKEIMKDEKEESLRFYKNEKEPLYQQENKKGGKKTLFLIILLIVVLAAIGFIFKHQIKGVFTGSIAPTPNPTSAPTPTPSPTPAPLVRSDWSFEVLNGSGVTGLAKTMADKLTNLGYSVVKTGNADKSNYKTTQVFVKSNLKDKVDLVIADLKDTVKIASFGGELTDSTASARIILGKDLSQ